MVKSLVGFQMVILLTINCHHQDPVSTSLDVLPEVILFSDWSVVSFSKDPVTIQEANVDGDRLKLKITYSGGDKKHDFNLFGSESFLESLPVQAELFLSHDANGDMAEALITEELTFNLSPLKELYRKMYHHNGSILLRIHEPGVMATFRALIIYEF